MTSSNLETKSWEEKLGYEVIIWVERCVSGAMTTSDLEAKSWEKKLRYEAMGEKESLCVCTR